MYGGIEWSWQNVPRGNETHPAAKVKLFVYEILDGSRVQATDKQITYLSTFLQPLLFLF